MYQNKPKLISADPSVGSSTTSTRRPGKKTYYTTDQILVLIEEQLKKYRAQMKKLKEKGSSDSQTNSLPSSSQGATSKSSASCGVRKATENSVDQAKGELKPSEIIRTNPERTESPHTEFSSTGYVMQEGAAVSAVKEVLFRTLSGPPLKELVNESPNLAYQKPSSQVQSVSVNIGDRNDLRSTGRDAGNDVDNSPNVMDSSVLNKLRFSNQQMSVPENQTQLSFLKAKEHRSFSADGGDSFTLSCWQSLDIVPDGEPEQKTQMEKEVQSDAGTDINLGLWVPQDTIPTYEDITDDEAVSESTQVLTHSSNGYVGVSEPSEQFHVNLNAIENPTQKQQQLPCSASDDGFEKSLSPKCAPVMPLVEQEVQSEDESDSEDVVLCATELFLIDEIIILDSDEEEPDVSSAEPNKQNMFKKIREYETFNSFYQSELKLHKNVPNPLKVEQDPAAPEHDADSHSAADESCDTDSSLDYSSQTKSNYLTVSDGISAPSPLSEGSSSEEEDDVFSSPATTVLTFFEKTEEELLHNSANWRICGAFGTADPEDSEPLHMKAKFKSRGCDQEKMKTSVPDSNGCIQQGTQPQNSPSASIHLQPMNQNLSTKGKITSTKKNEEKGQRKTFQDLQEKAPESRVNSHPGHEVNAQSAKRKMSQDNPGCPSMPHKRQRKSVDVKPAPASQRISSGKKQQTTNTSNVPTTKPVQPTPKRSVNQGQLTLQNPPTTRKSSLYSNEVNSYSTVRSTQAKKELVEQWSQNHIMIPKERRSSLKADGKRKTQDQNIPSQRSPRKKLRTPNVETSLMKKTKREAQQWTKDVHPKEAPRQSIDKSSGQRYKWRKELPLMKLGEEWLDEMYGEPYKRS